jgi:hypothetical protein
MALLKATFVSLPTADDITVIEITRTCSPRIRYLVESKDQDGRAVSAQWLEKPMDPAFAEIVSELAAMAMGIVEASEEYVEVADKVVSDIRTAKLANIVKETPLPEVLDETAGESFLSSALPRLTLDI